MESNGTTPNNGMTPEGDDALALALAGGKSQLAAAELAGVSRATVQRRLADPEFVSRVEAIRREWTERATGHLTEAAMEAVIKLRNIIASEGESSVHVAAARAILANLKLEGCAECERRAELERNPPPKTLEQELAHDRYIKEEYARLQALEARIIEEVRKEEAELMARMPPMKVLAYADDV